jgi:hypothetical protein
MTYLTHNLMDVRKIELDEIVDTHFHGFCRFIAIWTIKGNVPTIGEASFHRVGEFSLAYWPLGNAD